MGHTFRYRKKLLKVGHSRYVLIPADWQDRCGDDVIVEITDDKITIIPAEQPCKKPRKN